MTNPDPSGKSPARRTELLAYLLGLGTALGVCLMLLLFVGYRAGYGNLYKKARGLLPGQQTRLYMPPAILEELTAVDAVVGNAGNPTKRDFHDTILVRPDEELGFVLRPNRTIYASTLRSTSAFDLNPPVLFTDRPITELSGAVQAYAARQARVSCVYTTDADGFRNTLPAVESSRTILLVGDSVPFGTGVNDEHTVASHLQRMVGEQYRVLNAAVGAYNGRQAVTMANRLSRDRDFDVLVYVACQNDFMENEDWDSEAGQVLTDLHALSDRFNDNVFVVLHTFMPYNLQDVFMEKGWSAEVNGKTHALRRQFEAVSTRYEINYIDWSGLVKEFVISQQSIFSGFGLYVDSCHLSPTGNQLMAAKLFSSLQRRGLITG